MNDLFSSPVLRVDQPRNAPAARSRYTVKDGRGNLLATAEERDVSRFRQAVRTALGGNDGRRVVHVESAQGAPLMIVDKVGFTRGARVTTPEGAPIGSMTQTSKPYTYTLLDAAERPVGVLEGDLRGRKFAVMDGYGNHLAQVEKEWKGIATELLTTADRYSVQIHQPLYDPFRALVPAAPLAIDLMFYETKDWPIG